jgi:transcriptional regulator with XRE-family HTH domain
MHTLRIVQWGPLPDIGSRFRALRGDKGWSQVEAAERAGLSRSAVADVELGRWSPSWETFTKLARLYGVSLDWLAGLE